MNVLITGGTGAIGKKLIGRLKDYHYYLRILSRDNQVCHLEGVECVSGDLRDTLSLNQAVKWADVVIHLAGVTHTNNQSLYYRINTEGTKNLISACEKNGIKNFLFMSSRTASPSGGAYAHSKFLAEQALKSSTLNWVILQPAEVYGASNNEAIARLINFMKRTKLAPVLIGDQYRLCPLYVDDVVAAIVAILQKNSYPKKIYVLAGPEELTYNQLVDRLKIILGLTVVKIPIPFFLLKITTTIFNFLKINFLAKDQTARLVVVKPSDYELARRDLGFSPRSLEAGIPLLKLQNYGNIKEP